MSSISVNLQDDVTLVDFCRVKEHKLKGPTGPIRLGEVVSTFISKRFAEAAIFTPFVIPSHLKCNDFAVTGSAEVNEIITINVSRFFFSILHPLNYGYSYFQIA
jgi:hypothetical protein